MDTSGVRSCNEGRATNPSPALVHPTTNLAALHRLRSAATVFFGPRGAASELARQSPPAAGTAADQAVCCAA